MTTRLELVPGEGVAAAAATSSPVATSLLAGMVAVTVDTFDVCRGDVLVGFPRRVVCDVMQLPCGWVFLDDAGAVIDCRRIGSRVQVIRSESADDCPPFGISRPPRRLELVR